MLRNILFLFAVFGLSYSAQIGLQEGTGAIAPWLFKPFSTFATSLTTELCNGVVNNTVLGEIYDCDKDCRCVHGESRGVCRKDDEGNMKCFCETCAADGDLQVIKDKNCQNLINQAFYGVDTNSKPDLKLEFPIVQCHDDCINGHGALDGIYNNTGMIVAGKVVPRCVCVYPEDMPTCVL